MARPIKNFCDYFTHDRDMRNHKKIKAVRTKFGLPGYAIWNMILETLTGSDGNVLEYSDLEFELLSGDYGVSGAEIRSVVDYCVSLEMLFIKDGFFHSESLDERLAPVYEKRQVQKSKSSKQRRSHGKFTSDNTVDNGISEAETPYSKVKYSKVNKSRESISSDSADAASGDGDKTSENLVGIAKQPIINLSKKKKFPRGKKKESEWPQKLFNNIKVNWWKWFMERAGRAPKFSGASAKAIDHIRNYLITEGRKMNYAEENMIYDFGIEQFDLILRRWEELKPSNFLYEGVDIVDINKNLNRIINFYNNGRKADTGNSANGTTRKNTSDQRVGAIANWSLGFLKDGAGGSKV